MTSFFERIDSLEDRVALVDSAGKTLCYGELGSAASDLARKLDSNRCVIAIEAANTIETVIAYLATIRSNNVGLLVDARLSDEMRERLFIRYDVGLVLSGVTSGCSVIERSPVRARAPLPLSNGLALLLSTSGSTGSPKLVRLSASNIEENARAISTYLALDESERAITTLPLHYSYGLSILNSHLFAGASVAVTDQPVTSRAFWDLFREARATSLAGVPATWEMLQRLRFTEMALPTLRYCTQAGGRLNIDTMRYYSDWAMRTGRKFFVMYGQTEATARISYVPPQKLHEKIGSVGVAIPGGELSLVDPTGSIIDAPGEIGEIIYRGPNVMLGYADSAEDLSRSDDCRGVLNTGDLGYKDVDGFFYISGRLKRFAKLFGNRINLDEVETLLRSHDIVNAVTQHEDRLLVGVEQADPGEVARIVCSQLKVHHSAISVRLLDSLPRSASGKILYSTLVEIFDEDAEQKARAASPLET